MTSGCSSRRPYSRRTDRQPTHPYGRRRTLRRLIPSSSQSFPLKNTWKVLLTTTFYIKYSNVSQARIFIIDQWITRQDCITGGSQLQCFAVTKEYLMMISAMLLCLFWRSWLCDNTPVRVRRSILIFFFWRGGGLHFLSFRHIIERSGTDLPIWSFTYWALSAARVIDTVPTIISFLFYLSSQRLRQNSSNRSADEAKYCCHPLNRSEFRNIVHR